jgi:hypothetical protein
VIAVELFLLGVVGAVYMIAAPLLHALRRPMATKVRS